MRTVDDRFQVISNFGFLQNFYVKNNRFWLLDQRNGPKLVGSGSGPEKIEKSWPEKWNSGIDSDQSLGRGFRTRSGKNREILAGKMKFWNRFGPIGGPWIPNQKFESFLGVKLSVEEIVCVIVKHFYTDFQLIMDLSRKCSDFIIFS